MRLLHAANENGYFQRYFLMLRVTKRWLSFEEVFYTCWTQGCVFITFCTCIHNGTNANASMEKLLCLHIFFVVVVVVGLSHSSFVCLGATTTKDIILWIICFFSPKSQHDSEHIILRENRDFDLPEQNFHGRKKIDLQKKKIFFYLQPDILLHYEIENWCHMIAIDLLILIDDI